MEVDETKISWLLVPIGLIPKALDPTLHIIQLKPKLSCINYIKKVTLMIASEQNPKHLNRQLLLM